MLEQHVNPLQNSEIFENLDDELGRRSNERSLKIEDISKILKILSDHNNLCPQGYEITLEMFINESIDIIEQNIGSVSKEDFINISIGLGSSGILENYESTVKVIEK